MTYQTRYSCHNKPREVPAYFAQDGYHEAAQCHDGTFCRAARHIVVQHVMSTDCRYDRAQTDPRCAGCHALPNQETK